MERKEYVAFVRVNNLSDFSESVLAEIELAIDEILEGEAVYSLPQDPSVETEDVPVVVEITFFAFKFGIKSYNSDVIKELAKRIQGSLENILFHKRRIIVISQKVARSETVGM